MSGFITIERKLWDHPVFAPSAMTEREAWVWMIAQAAWAETRHRVGSEMVAVPRGSFMSTLREMQAAFMWKSDTKVRNFLKMLENERMIKRTVFGSRNAPKTQISVCNYDEYQSGGRTKNAPDAAPKTHEETHQKRTKNAVKKQINKITKEPNGSKDAGAIEILSGIVPQQLASDFAEHRRGLKKPLTEKAAAAIVSKLDGHHDPNSVLTDSIANGWQGVFPKKTKPKFKAINGGQHERTYGNPETTQRPDPALEQIARLTNVGQAPGGGGV